MCTEALRKDQNKQLQASYSRPYPINSIKCPLCRELSTQNESYLVTTRNIKQEKVEKPTLLNQISDKFNCNDSDYKDYSIDDLNKITLKVS